MLNRKEATLRIFQAIPSLDNPTWIIPVNNKLVAKSSLEMYQPSKKSVRLLKNILSFSLTMGLSPLLNNVIIVLEPLGLSEDAMTEITKFLSQIYDINNIEMALFTGTPGLTAKKSLQIMNRNTGGIKSYIRIGENPFTKTLLENEMKILKRLKGLSLRSAQIPTVLLYERHFQISFLLISTHRKPGCYYTHHIEASHVKFLGELFKKTLRKMFVSRWLERNIKIIGENNSIIVAIKYIKNIMKNKKIEICMIQGDFTPWNMFFTPEGELFIFDWELARIDGLPYYDLINFKIKNDILVKHMETSMIFKGLYSSKFQGLVKSYIEIAGLNSNIEFKIYLFLYLLRELNLYSKPFTNEKEELNRKVTVKIFKDLLNILMEKS